MTMSMAAQVDGDVSLIANKTKHNINDLGFIKANAAGVWRTEQNKTKNLLKSFQFHCLSFFL